MIKAKILLGAEMVRHYDETGRVANARTGCDGVVLNKTFPSEEAFNIYTEALDESDGWDGWVVAKYEDTEEIFPIPQAAAGPSIPYGRWTFLYPMAWFDIDASDDVILAAYLHEENKELFWPIERMTPEEFVRTLNTGEFSSHMYYVRMIEITAQNQPPLKYQRLSRENFLGIMKERDFDATSDDEFREIETLYNEMVMKAYREKIDGMSSYEEPAAGSIIPEFLAKAISTIRPD